ncbi:MAG: glycosyltransferase family 2 protein [Gammaproteobacteria bacterium]|nr:glycosyltransferase family 2 protein [Gammaproteobacteria bacterium]
MRDEASVMKAWKTHRSPLVSIACIAYNQESYIEEAISGFLSQETDFPFEIILHDDASTDRTRAIIEDYAARYPQIIRPVFQTENQHSQPDKNVQLIAISYAKGEYIALCEGDDCWINPHKLQQQIEALRQHPECGACFHPAIRRCVQHPAKDKIIARHHVGNTIFSPHAVILGAAGFCPTASLVIKKKVFETLPEWFYRVPTGDYFIQMLSSYFSSSL